MPGHGEVAQRARRSANGSGTSRRCSTCAAQPAATAQRAGSSVDASRIDAPPRGEMSPPSTPAWSGSSTAAAPRERGSVASSAASLESCCSRA